VLITHQGHLADRSTSKLGIVNTEQRLNLSSELAASLDRNSGESRRGTNSRGGRNHHAILERELVILHVDLVHRLIMLVQCLIMVMHMRMLAMIRRRWVREGKIRPYGIGLGIMHKRPLVCPDALVSDHSTYDAHDG